MLINKMTKYFKINSILCLLFISFQLICQNQNFNKETIKTNGIPYIINYAPNDYKAAAQNWAILQDKRGIMYFGNGNGLMEFDGKDWRLIQMPNKSLVRSLAMDKNGKIYVGTQGELGYLEADERGLLQYVSLVSKIPAKDRNFEGVSKIYITAAGVLFQTATAIYLYLDDHFRVIKPKYKFEIGFHVHGIYYVNELKYGLFYLDNGLLKIAKGGSFFKSKQIDLMLPYNENKILITTRENGLFIYNPKSKKQITTDNASRYLSRWKTPLEKFIKSNPIYCGIEFGKNFYVFGTLKNGLVVTDRNGNPIKHINEKSGLQNDLVWSVSIDSYGNAWLGLDVGIAYVILNSPFSYFNIEGSVLSITVFNQKLYIGTTEGIWVKNLPKEQNPLALKSKFQFIKNTNEQAWYIAEVDGILLAAHSKGLFQIKGNTAFKITSDYTWTFRKLKGKKNHYLAGTYNNGLILLEKRGQNIIVKKRYTGFKESARYLELDENNNIWISHPYKGIYKIKLSDNLDSITNFKLYTADSGLPSDTYNFVFDFKNKIICGTEKGIYYYNSNLDRFFKDKKYGKLLGNNNLIRKFEQDDKGNIWYVSNGQLGFLESQKNNYYTVQQNLFYKFKDFVIYHITPIDSNNVFFGTPNSLIHYNPEIAKKDESFILKPFSSFIRKVQGITYDTVIYGGSLPISNSINPIQTKLPFEINSLRFSYAATWFENSEQTVFQYYLKGFDKSWSSWTKNAEKEYTNLPSGDYTFLVRAKNVYEMVSTESNYNFTIYPPWYGTKIARTIYIIISIFIVWGIVKIREKQHLRDKEKLELIISKRTFEIVDKKNEIENKNVKLEQQNEKILQQNEELKSLLMKKKTH